MDKTQKALWFSRHQMTAAQIEDAQKMGYSLVYNDEAGMVLV
jgi:hypothetical protein